jgi:DNA repair protein RadC
MIAMKDGKRSYPIREWPEDDRPREKLLRYGADRLTDAELLAIILRTGDGNSGASALDYARYLLRRCGSFRDLASLSVRDLSALKGIGPAKAASVQAVMEIARRYGSRPLFPGRPLTSSSDVFAHFHERLRDRKKEYFYAVLLDNKHRTIREITVSEGTLTSSLVHPREVFGPAVRESAASVILVHNHPSGDPAPSREDDAITRRLVEVGALLGLAVLDHVIVGEKRYYSFADEGRLS